MISILQTQFFRLKRSKLFWAMMIVCAALPILLVLFVSAINLLFQGEMDIWEVLGQTLSAEYFLSTFAAFSNTTPMLAVIASGIILSKEFSQGTMRNAVLANKSRSQLFFAYYIISLIVGLSYFFVEFVVTAAICGVVLGFELSGGALVTNLLSYFAMGLFATILIETTVCMMLFGTRKPAATVIVPLVIFEFGVGIISTILQFILMAVMATGHLISDVALQCIPFYNLTLLGAGELSGLNVGMVLLYDLIFTAGAFLLGFFPFQKADLK